MSTRFLEGYLASESADRDVIKVKRIYIQICGDNLTDAVLFSQIMYWHGRDKSGQSRLRVARGGHLWLAKRYEDWWAECRINASTARDAIKRLCKIGLIEKRLFHFDGKPVVHLRVVPDKFEELITAAMKTDNKLESEDSSLNVRNPSNGNYGIRRMETTESVDSYTETTAEITDNDSADTPSGGQRHVVELPTPETERKRDPIFEVVIARNFGVALDDKAGVEAVRDKANWITSWLKGNAVKKNSRDKRKSLPGCSPPASPEEVGAFYDWWEREKGIDKPSTALGIAQFMSVFRQERKPARTGPAVHFPKPQHRCTVCGDQDTGEGATGMYVGPDGKSIPCPACLAAEQAAQEVRDEQAA